MEKYGTLIFLLFSSFLDIRKREISIPVTLMFGLAGVAYSIKTGRTMTDYLIPAAIGIFILACSILTRGQVGMGDGWLLMALGCMMRMESYIQMAASECCLRRHVPVSCCWCFERAERRRFHWYLFYCWDM